MKRRQNLSHEESASQYFPGSHLPSVSSSQAAPSDLTLLPLLRLAGSQSPFLIYQQLDPEPCLRTPAPGASPFPFMSVCADGHAPIYPLLSLSILTFILKQLSFPLG